MSNLLSKASILLTPTATSDGKLHNIKPNTTTGDFTFTRGTAATRVNSNGLIESVASGLPRIDFLGGTGQVLLEPATINTATYSNDFSQGDIFNGSGNPSLTGAVLSANQGTAPDGTNAAQKLIDNNDGSSGSVAINFFSTNITAGADSTISVFAKKNGANVLRINMTGFDIGRAAFFDLVNGTKSGTTQSTIEDYGNGWFKCSVTMNTTTDTVGAVLFNVCSDSNQTSITRDGTKSILLWGMQAEEQSFPTSYLPTSGSFVSRNKSEAINSGDISLFNSTEGVLYAEVARFSGDTSFSSISISDGSLSDVIAFKFRNVANQVISRVAGASTNKDITVTTSDISQFTKLAISYSTTNDISKFYINGVEVGTISLAGVTISGLATLQFNKGVSGEEFQGKVKTVAVFKEALTDAQLISLTS